MRRRCLGYNNNHCPAIINTGSRCRTCRTQMYGSTWQRQSRTARANQPWCTWCGSTENLQLDHIRAGSTAAGTQVLCGPCNLAKAQGQPPPHTLS